jgi:hypothetical protein
MFIRPGARVQPFFHNKLSFSGDSYGGRYDGYGNFISCFSFFFSDLSSFFFTIQS